MVKHLKNFGVACAKIGAHIWEKNSKQFSGESTAEEQWEDLNRRGKFGFKLMCFGFEILGFKPEDIQNFND